MSEPQTGVTITLVDVYRAVEDLRSEIVKVTTHMERVDQRNLSADQLHSDHEARLRALERIDADGLHALYGRVGALEKFRYTLAGALALFTLLLSVAGYIIGALTGHR